jgi:hypothetical protein
MACPKDFKNMAVPKIGHVPSTFERACPESGLSPDDHSRACPESRLYIQGLVPRAGCTKYPALAYYPF